MMQHDSMVSQCCAHTLHVCPHRMPLVSASGDEGSGASGASQEVDRCHKDTERPGARMKARDREGQAALRLVAIFDSWSQFFFFFLFLFFFLSFISALSVAGKLRSSDSVTHFQ